MPTLHLITLDRAPDRSDHYIHKDGVIAIGKAPDNFDTAKSFMDAGAARQFANKHYPDWDATIDYMFECDQEAFWRRKMEVAP